MTEAKATIDGMEVRVDYPYPELSGIICDFRVVHHKSSFTGSVTLEHRVFFPDPKDPNERVCQFEPVEGATDIQPGQSVFLYPLIVSGDETLHNVLIRHDPLVKKVTIGGHQTE